MNAVGDTFGGSEPARRTGDDGEGESRPVKGGRGMFRRSDGFGSSFQLSWRHKTGTGRKAPRCLERRTRKQSARIRTGAHVKGRSSRNCFGGSRGAHTSQRAQSHHHLR